MSIAPRSFHPRRVDDVAFATTKSFLREKTTAVQFATLHDAPPNTRQIHMAIRAAKQNAAIHANSYAIVLQ